MCIIIVLSVGRQNEKKKKNDTIGDIGFPSPRPFGHATARRTVLSRKPMRKRSRGRPRRVRTDFAEDLESTQAGRSGKDV